MHGNTGSTRNRIHHLISSHPMEIRLYYRSLIMYLTRRSCAFERFVPFKSRRAFSRERSGAFELAIISLMSDEVRMMCEMLKLGTLKRASRIEERRSANDVRSVEVAQVWED
jgi:hypothetical protein